MLERENKFYMANQAEFREKYFDKWLVIVGESLWGVYDKFSDAGKAALQNFEADTEIMIHRPADDDRIIEIGPFLSVTRPDIEEDDIPEPVTIASKGETIVYPYAH
jgi:hypothetical protein